MIDISIVSYNSERHLPGLLNSLEEQDVDCSQLTLTFVDNNSSDSSCSLIKRFISKNQENFKRLELIYSQENLGFGRAHNLAQKERDNPYLLILNPDTVPHRTFFSELLSLPEGAPDEVAAWEPRQTPYEHPKIYKPDTSETSWVSGACTLFRRSAFEKVGGYEEMLFLYGEDVELSWRLRAEGFKLLYCPRILIEHNTYSEAQEFKPAQFIGSTRANLLLRTRFGSIRDILVGLFRQAVLFSFPSRQYLPKQRKEILKTIKVWLKTFRHFRAEPKWRFGTTFYGWDYEIPRMGAFYQLEPSKLPENPPKVSVLIRTIGRLEVLRAALLSVANQTYRNIEVVVVEDGTHKASRLIDEFKDSLDINYECFEKPRGRCHAATRAMELSSGEFLNFLDEDDMLYADHFEVLISEALKTKSKVVYSYAFELPTEFDAEHRVINESFPWPRYKEKFSFVRLMIENFMPIQSVCFRRELFEQVGGFDPELDMNEDWNFWVKIANVYRSFNLVEKTTSLYRVPLKSKLATERHKELNEYYELAKKKNAELGISLSLKELHEYRELNSPPGLKTLLIQRIPVLRFPAKMAAFFVRRVRRSLSV